MIKRMTVFFALLIAVLPGLSLFAAEFTISADTEVIGEIQRVRAVYEDTFVILARRHNVGYEELRRANPGVDPWLPGAGTEIVLPTQFVLPRAERRGIVINLPELRLYYFPDAPDAHGQRVITHPISVGRMDWATPLGRTSIVAKAKNPSWYPPQSIRDEHAARNDPLPNVVPPGPDNPLGNHALRLGIPGYLIHGTNKPSGVGMRVTHGCIRMFPEDIEALFGMVDSGTQVRIVNQPFKLGWGEGGLYLEAHLPLEEPDQVNDLDEPSRALELEADQVPADAQWTATELTRIYVAATQEREARMDWLSAERIMQAALGMPEFVSMAVEAPIEPSLAAEVPLLDQ
jgi:L,D-transpeptidase ErfK/SrfK